MTGAEKISAFLNAAMDSLDKKNMSVNDIDSALRMVLVLELGRIAAALEYQNTKGEGDKWARSKREPYGDPVEFGEVPLDKR